MEELGPAAVSMRGGTERSGRESLSSRRGDEEEMQWAWGEIGWYTVCNKGVVALCDVSSMSSCRLLQKHS